MPAHQKVKVIEAVTELKRRKLEERIRYFVPVKTTDKNAFGVKSNDQYGFIHSTAKERWALGGNRSGKSEVGVADCTLFATGKHPVRSLHRKPPVFIRYCAPSYEDSIKAVIHKKFRQLLIRSDLRKDSWSKAWSEMSKTLHFKNGTKINFKSGEQHVDKYGGDDLDAVYVDEHLGIRYYRENKMRLIDRDGFMVNTMTPEEGAVSWEKKHIKKTRGKGSDVFTFSTFGNPHLSKAGIEEVLRTIKDPRLRDVKLFGKFIALAGLVYDQWDEDIHAIDEIEIPNNWYKVFVLDPHLKKESAMIWCAWHPDGKDLFIYRVAKKFLTVPELKQFIRVKSAGERIQLWIGDEAMGGVGENIFGQESVLVQLSSGTDSIPIVGTNLESDKDFKAGVFKVRDMLTADTINGKPNLYVLRSYCGDSNQDLIDEFDEYQFIPDMKADEMTFRERVRKVDDDLVTCVRYAVQAGSVQGDGKSIKSALDGSWEN